MKPLTLNASQRPDGALVLTAVGEIDMGNVDAFASALTQAAADHTSFVVDLTAVDYLDSAGLTALFAHADHIELLANPLLAPVLTISGLGELIPIRGIDPDTTVDGIES
ncbi:STAS domain-containing protein [Streptomyces sp. NPDC046557]|uniref:STAS domain-containing protein n=1 Tax=Streptomyces sp. NPDC046557 TaxID=3155372 RepID=UPI0033FE6C2C